MKKNGWLKVFNAAKSYGLNHLRFHSWCPPAAAFEAADEMGFYLGDQNLAQLYMYISIEAVMFTLSWPYAWVGSTGRGERSERL